MSVLWALLGVVILVCPVGTIAFALIARFAFHLWRRKK